MDWQSVTFDWNRVRAFLVTAEEGSLSAAARALGLAQPTLGRQVDALEQELGVALFERAGRGLELTPIGRDLLQHAQLMGEGAQALALGAMGQSQSLEGDVVLTASDAYCAYLLPPILADLHARHPAIRVELLASNDTADLRRHEADIALRNFRPTEPDLVARKLRDATAQLYATPEYLNSIDRPQGRADFKQATFIEIDGSGALRNMLTQQGFPLGAQNFPYRSRNFVVMWEMVRRGMGIGVIDERIGGADPLVEPAVPDFAGVDFPVWLVAHRDLLRSRRMRVVFDALAEGMS